MNRAFRVTVAGRGCLVRVDYGDIPGQIERLGFFTTRFVVASSVESATALALQMVREELGDLLTNAVDQPYELQVEEAHEDPDGYHQFGVGGGFTWYPDDPEACRP